MSTMAAAVLGKARLLVPGAALLGAAAAASYGASQSQCKDVEIRPMVRLQFRCVATGVP